MTYQVVTADLRRAYDAEAASREGGSVEDWKAEERRRFLELLRAEGKTGLLEVGAGTGVHGKYFLDQGIQVVSTDLSPVMVEFCRAKGLEAHVMDFLSLDFGNQTFDAAFAMNCLLHVPRADLQATLQSIAAVLRPGALFYLGQYGGAPFEGVWPEDTYEPKRFFSYMTDDDLMGEASQVFDLLDFRRIALHGRGGLDFQALVLRRRED